MEIKTVTYQCPNCSAALEYNNALGKFKCLFCDSEFTEEDIKKRFAENEGFELSQENLEAEQEAAQDESNRQAEEFAGASALYTCPNCGAGVICDSLTASTRCHFCHTPVILTGRLSGEFRPNLIIPFARTREQAETAFKEYCKGKFLLPKGFASEAQIQNITPLYVPYWLKSGTVDAFMEAEGHKVHSWRAGDTRFTNTKIFNVTRRAEMTFVRVPCDGSKRIDDSLMESIEPFDYTGIKPFSMSYLSGCGAEKYDVTVQEAAPVIDKRISDAAADLLRSDMNGYSTIAEKRRNISFTKQQTVYGLLPVWFLNYTYKGRDYPFVMNGQTGCNFGILPVSGLKKFLFGAGLFIVLGALEDHQDALSGEQAQELLDLLDSTAREIHANVGVILGNASLDGLSERSYAKEFHNRSFGEYSDSIVLMLVQAGSGKVDQIYCTDRAYDMYQPRIDSIFDAVYDGLDSSGGDNYYAAVTNYCAYLRSHDSVPPKVDINIGHVGGVIVALIIAVCVANSQAAKYKKRAPVSARRYMDGSMTRFTQRGDVFVREYTTSHRISSSSSGGSRHSGGGGHRSGGGGGRRR